MSPWIFDFEIFFLLAAMAVLIGIAQAITDNSCFIKPISVSVGKDDYPNYFFVVDDTTSAT